MGRVLERRVGTDGRHVSTITGGIRLRLLRDSALHAVTDGLAEQGWFQPNRRHRPVTVTSGALDWDEPVQSNLVTVSIDAVSTEQVEVGSTLTNDTIRLVTDLFVENDTVGVELANDIRDIYRGRIGTVMARAALPIWDYRLATPVTIAYATFDQVRIVRSVATAQQLWQRFWFTVIADVSDAYYTADG
jgi:hypothetical protein